ncbi:MAG: cysteine hydrolase [Bacilli bacterium]|nr:cysteine hydrolase [Bacilli bacterium]
MKKLLIVVDYQNDFVTGSLGFKKAVDIEKGIFERVKEYEENGDDVIFTLDTHEASYLKTEEGIYLPVEHCLKGTNGHELYGLVKEVAKNHLLIEKATFPSHKLLNYLLDKEYECIELCGVVTNICVISNAIIVKAALPNAHIVINQKLCASNDEVMEQKALEVMKNLQMEII